MGRDLAIYSDGIVRYRPASFTPEGAPVYSPAAMDTLPVSDRGDLIPIEDANTLLVLSSTGYGETSYVRGLDLRTWKELWRYPSYHHGVHGSHHATMPEPGRIIGALKVTGVARVDGESVFSIRGNLGEDYFMTADGLFVGTVFRDSRLPGPSLPAREEEVLGKPVPDLTEGGEPFNGWFGLQSDGKVRMLTGIPGQAGMIVEIRGLDSIRRFQGPQFDVDQKAVVQAEQANALRTAARATRRQYTIKRLPADGDWRPIPHIEVAREGLPERANVKIAWDDRFLHLSYEVTDASPWRNSGPDLQRLFKTGDAVDLQIRATAHPDSAMRLLIAPYQGRAVCILSRPVDKGAPREKAFDYGSPTGVKHFDRVEILDGARIDVKVEEKRYVVRASIPLSAIDLQPAPGLVLRGDVGFISSDAAGQSNVARTYWSNSVTNLTNDLPSEAALTPQTWGGFTFD
jgi:hypothetical protein